MTLFERVFHLDLNAMYRKIIHGITLWAYKPQYYGMENIPETGPAIIISNHVSYMDGLIIDAGCKRPIRYIIDQDIYHFPIVHYIMKRAQAIPIAPNRKSVEAAFNEISNGLKAGDLICIFPEGFLTFTGGLGRFKPGIEWMIKRDPVPVIPIALSGLWGSIFSRKYLKSPLRWLPREWVRGKVIVKCGKPLDPSEININYLQDVVMKLKYSIKE
jgi:1-acyl-sn-glycerol-3-phosphate acyltransferase